MQMTEKLKQIFTLHEIRILNFLLIEISFRIEFPLYQDHLTDIKSKKFYCLQSEMLRFV